MDELEKFIVFWLGSRSMDYGEPDSVIERVSLPYPLRRLYAFAGKWPPLYPIHTDQPNVFCVQDCLLPLGKLSVSEDGKLPFVVENQSCWTSSTLPYGDDPPVWVEGDFLPSSGWHVVTESLSRFLVSFCLQELLFGSMLRDGATIPEHLSPMDPHRLTPLWTAGPYVHEATEHTFYLLDDEILVGPFGLENPWYGVRPITAS